MYTLFKANADKPPIFKNQPPVAGAISWERSLFLRIKHTILRFQEMEDMLNSEQGKLVRPECSDASSTNSLPQEMLWGGRWPNTCS